MTFAIAMNYTHDRLIPIAMESIIAINWLLQ